jgi:hypothetical protein
MNARINRAPPGFVTVAEAAAELTRRGDAITPPNVSRYLDRNTDISSEKAGKYRYVDLAALIMHRSGNVQSHAKRDAALPSPAPASVVEDDGAEGGGANSSGISRAIQEANLRLKNLQVRDAEREDQLAEGELVPAADVLSVVTMSLQAMISELERAEVSIAARHGRAVATDFRKSRKEAQAKAAEQLTRLAKKHLHPAVAAQLAEAPMPEAAAA